MEETPRHHNNSNKNQYSSSDDRDDDSIANQDSTIDDDKIDYDDITDSSRSHEMSLSENSFDDMVNLEKSNYRDSQNSDGDNNSLDSRFGDYDAKTNYYPKQDNLTPAKQTANENLDQRKSSTLHATRPSSVVTSSKSSLRRRDVPQLDGKYIDVEHQDQRLSCSSLDSDTTYDYIFDRQSPSNVISNSSAQKHHPSNILPNFNKAKTIMKLGQRISTCRPQYLRLTTTGHDIFDDKSPNFMSRMPRRIIYAISVIIITLIMAMLIIILIRLTTKQDVNFLGTTDTESILGTYKNYAVSTDASLCASVGSKLIDKGGSAVDCAIGTLLCMGLIIPNSMGLGGGTLMTIYNRKKREAIIVDGREEAPDYATENMFGTNSLAASRGPLSVGIPGELRAYHYAHSHYGKLNWSELFEDTIKMAEDGVPIVEHMHYAMHLGSHAKHMSPSLRNLFTNHETGSLYKEGEIIKRPDLAKTLTRIRDHGVDEFYGGETGRLFIEDLQKQGGKLTLDNLKRYNVNVKSPVSTRLADDLIMHTQPMPGSGPILSLIMRIMGKFGYYSRSDVINSFEESELYYHRLMEAFKFAYAQRAGLDDSSDLRMEKLLSKLSSHKFVEEIVAMIGNGTNSPDYYGAAEYFAEDHGTAHVSVIDKEGNSIAATTSVNLYFGSGLLSESTGIIYNDIMDDFVSPKFKNSFNLPPSKYNRISPGKRPLSSMVPTIFTNADGDVRLSIGASGGSKITTAVATVSLRHLFLGDDIKTAIDGPRLHHQLIPNKIVYELGFPKSLLQSLNARGHNISELVGRSSVVMAVASNKTFGGSTEPIVSVSASGEDKVITANSDYRKRGSVGGD